MPIQNTPTSTAGQQLLLPIEAAPPIVRSHGYSDAHERPLVMPKKGAASWRTTPAEAWGYRYLELNPANSVAVLTLDVDDQERILDLLSPFAASRPLPEPNWTVLNPRNGHGHPSWCLSVPVHLNRESSMKPQRKIARISEWYREAAGADAGYAGVLSKNPYMGRGGRTYWGRRRPYTLGELGELLPKGYRLAPRPVTAIGRNVSLFQTLMKFAGRPTHREVPLMPAAESINAEFHEPLPGGEVRSSVKSVSGYRDVWIAEGRYYQHDSATQRARQAKGAAARRERNRDRDGRIVRLRDEGLTLRSIAAEVGLGKDAVADVLRKSCLVYLHR